MREMLTWVDGNGNRQPSLDSTMVTVSVYAELLHIHELVSSLLGLYYGLRKPLGKRSETVDLAPLFLSAPSRETRAWLLAVDRKGKHAVKRENSTQLYSFSGTQLENITEINKKDTNMP